ncbi:MAG: NADH-quinone oxidoreductase subunit NuoK [Bacteroidaceae bacterium]|jgi:NADH-quinone oxidoreductase subunit K|nr:NADH-quinone oxidoreductase subunit NuoK [Bacteroidales bacterium]MBP3350491.1 NADH-quinone oxidoreductase subunit NuoK [Bacteroidaceae bacterium]MBQ5749896.1 NADH-quinone oxidoreductase subunit NuoK [Bacteroidaceae bacterium]MBQ6938970.1 NADH-quinone oxidoreductase subunit NuoK [Muribaculaceae bacterium]
MEIPMIYYIVLSLVMFFAGVYGFITRKNMLMMLISIELMLNAVDINFAVFNRFLFPGQMEGMIFSIFAIAIAAAETAIAIAIIINIYRHIRNIDADNLDDMKY